MRATSMLAWEKIKSEGLLSARRLQTLHAVMSHGPATAQELKDRTGVPGLWKRLSELRDLGCIREAGEVKCKVTGQVAILWVSTDRVPDQNLEHRAKRQRTRGWVLESAPGDTGLMVVYLKEPTWAATRCVEIVEQIRGD